jgi:hypothetical protein
VRRRQPRPGIRARTGRPLRRGHARPTAQPVGQRVRPLLPHDLTRRFIRRRGELELGARDWFVGRVPHFKRGTIGELLDFGIAKLQSASPDEFLKQLVNGNIDMVLCGHVHERVEFRVRLDSGGQLQLFTDFYTENPSRFREGKDWPPDSRPIFLRVDPEARAGATPRQTTDHSPDGLPSNAPAGTIMVSRNLAIPPYDDPLSDASDKTAWWDKHRPLILQTACLGPIDYVQRVEIVETVNPPRATRRSHSFQGVRLFAVDGNCISHASYVGIEEIRALASPG